MSATQQILGVRFFDGTPAEAVAYLTRVGGYVVVPAAPALTAIQFDAAYRDALVKSDMAIADSGFMVLLWRMLKGRRITRISGLAYLKSLLEQPAVRSGGRVFFVVPTPSAQEKALAWALKSNRALEPAQFYVAPRYDSEVADKALCAILEEAKPEHIVIGLGGGVQEKLGLFLRENLSYRPAIHCIGAALGFITGDQRPIPDWADRLYLGWFLRLVRNPRLYLRRFWAAHALPRLIWRYGEQLPPLKT